MFPKYKNKLYKTRQCSTFRNFSYLAFWAALVKYNLLFVYPSNYPSICSSSRPTIYSHLFLSVIASFPVRWPRPLGLWESVTDHLTCFSWIQRSSLSHFLCQYWLSYSVSRRQSLQAPVSALLLMASTSLGPSLNSEPHSIPCPPQPRASSPDRSGDPEESVVGVGLSGTQTHWGGGEVHPASPCAALQVIG